MKFYLPPRWKIYTFLISMPIAALIINLILYRDRVWTDARVWWVAMPLVFMIGAISWYTHYLQDLKIENKYPELDDSSKRIFFKVLTLFVLMPPGVLLGLYLFDRFHILGYHWAPGHTMELLAVTFSVKLILRTLYEGDYIFRKYRITKQEREMMSQLSVYQELDTLKNQINPHFLFNCFNTLSSLIVLDKHKAEDFLNELSKVYRYLLRNNAEGLSTVGNEVKFIESYFQLLQTRHGEAVKLNIQIDRQYTSYLVPSLSLQLLVENAVKHNMLSRSQPLVIDIFTTAGNRLVVNNNLQRRLIKVPSNKVGLENIKSKYLLLRQPGFQVMEDEKNYTVVLPLIWNQQ